MKSGKSHGHNEPQADHSPGTVFADGHAKSGTFEATRHWFFILLCGVGGSFCFPLNFRFFEHF